MEVAIILMLGIAGLYILVTQGIPDFVQSLRKDKRRFLRLLLLITLLIISILFLRFSLELTNPGFYR